MTTSGFTAKEGTDYWLNIMISSAPEREDEIRSLWHKYSPIVEVENNNTIRLTASIRGLKIDIKTPEVYWLIVFAGWKALEVYGPSVVYSSMSGMPIAEVLAHDSELQCMEHDYRACMRTAHDYKNSRDVNSIPWPPDIPRPSGDRFMIVDDHYRLTFDLACSALGFMLFHEFYHIVLLSDNRCPNDIREEEMQCDVWARDFLTAKVAEYAAPRQLVFNQVLERRSMAVVLSALIIFEITPSWAHGGTENYFSVRDRITALFSNTSLPAGCHFWNFAAAVLIGMCRSKNIQFAPPSMTAKLLAEHLLQLL
jgi:hypothetical protein